MNIISGCIYSILVNDIKMCKEKKHEKTRKIHENVKSYKNKKKTAMIFLQHSMTAMRTEIASAHMLTIKYQHCLTNDRRQKTTEHTECEDGEKQ